MEIKPLSISPWSAIIRILFLYPLLVTVNIHLADAQITRFDNWQSYSSMYDTQVIEIDDFGHYWVGTTGGLYIYKPDTDSFEYLRGPAKLMENDVTALRWDNEHSRMFVGFGNGGINIVGYDGLAINKITNNTDIISAGTALPRINSFEIADDRVYVGGGFGFATLLPDQNIFLEDTKKFADLPVGTAVNNILILGNRVHVSTERGIVFAEIEQSLADPSQWTRAKQEEDTDANFGKLEQLNGIVLASNGKQLFRLEGDTLIVSEANETLAQFDISASGGEVYVLDSFNITSAFSEKSFPLYNFEGKTLKYYQQKLLLGTRKNSLILYDIESGDTTYISPKTPQSNFVKKIYIDDINNDIYYTTGDVGAAGVQRLTVDGWITYNSRTVAGFNNGGTEDVERLGDKIFVASFGGGIFQINANTAEIEKHFTGANTNLTEFGPNFLLVTDLEQDVDGKIWAVVPGEVVPGTIIAYYDETSETWIGEENKATNDRWNNLVEIDDLGNKWLGGYVANNRGLIYYNEKNVEDTEDDVWGNLSISDDPLLLSNQHNALEMDNNGNLWIGTNEGLTVLLNPGGVANGNNPVFVEKREFVNFPISALAVDPVNNMWVGTSQGISIYGPDGEDIISTINAENSELLTNTITDIKVSDDGTIYIGTQSGLYSLSSSFTEPSNSYSIEMYPQPFDPLIDEGLTINGLAPDSDIRIMTPGGDYIAGFTTTSGTFIWDGRDNTRANVRPGVYILIATSESTDNAEVVKFAVVNK